MTRYYINYHTGAGNRWIDAADLDAAKSDADKDAAYTQQPITIEDEDGNELSRRAWWGYDYDDSQSDPIRFGTFGFYGDWVDA